MSDTFDNSLFLELGDIIKINAPSNIEINEHVFIIDYIDSDNIYIVDDTTLVQTNLALTDGDFNDKSIENIEILSRSDEKGYARQNNLLPGKTITIRFGGSIPTTINGTITQLEEDMIEIKTFPENNVIYIDFGYHGIPKNLPIESIEEFKIPVEEPEKFDLEKKEDEDIISKVDDESSDELIDKQSDGQSDEEMEFDLVMPNTAIKNRLKRTILDADDIKIGKNLGSIIEEVPVGESHQRYGIDTQANDLLDEMLSTIPSAHRTSKALNNIHLMIERFKQLRSQFSIISTDGEIMKPKKKGNDYKPLIQKLKTFNKNLYWLLPVVKNRKKLYNVDNEDATDIISVTLDDTHSMLEEFVEQYKQNRIPDGLNKYKYLYREINKLYTPFGSPMDYTDVISEEKINDNFNVIVDNHGDFYSSVSRGESNIIDKKRFLIQKYNLGLTELEIENDSTKTGYNPKRIQLTPNDKAAITGIITLNDSALLYSRVNLPNSSILLKSHLALVSFNYWSIFKKNRDIVNIDVELDSEIIEEENLFMKDINAFMFKENMRFADRSDDVFELFLSKVIPRTKDLFKLIKKHIKNTTSYLKLIENLEPFLVYPDDITFKQYEHILVFLKEKISLFKKKLVKSDIDYNAFIANEFPSQKINNLLLSSDSIKPGMEEYNMRKLTTDEAILKMITIDCGRLYYSIIAHIDIDLFQPVDIDMLIKEELNKKPEVEENKSDCKTYVMAKYYIGIDELREDDGKIIYFDKKYDTTRYDIISNFKEQQINKSPNEFKTFLTEHLIKNIGMSVDTAQRESKSIIDKKREVIKDNYAYILDSDHQPVYFYRNENNIWVKNELFSGKKFNEIMFCNIKNSCINIKKKCGPIEINQKEIQKDLYKEILSQFDKRFNISTDNIHKMINESYNYNFQNIKHILYLNHTLNIKNQTKNNKIANTLEERDIIQSPHENLRNMVLSQQDFIKKQKDIISFCDKYTRSYFIDNPDENKYWFYCVETSVPLIPTFYKRLANAFYIGNYEDVLEQIKAERGKLSDDGDKVVDRFSGFIISKMDYDESEGYNEQGFKIVSRSALDANIEKIVSDSDFKMPDSNQSKDTVIILNIVTTLDKHLGISVESQFDFIINLVNMTLDKYAPSREKYERTLLESRKTKKRKKKKQPSFEDIYNDMLMMTTLSGYTIAIQSMMPSIRTKKTFPTCSRSFKGYPVEGDNNTSGLQYIICAAINIARGSDAIPWNALPRVRKKTGVEETINKYVSKMKSFMDSAILINNDVKKRYLINCIIIFIILKRKKFQMNLMLKIGTHFYLL